MYDDRKKLEYRRRRFIARLEREIPDMIASLEDGWLIAAYYRAPADARWPGRGVQAGGDPAGVWRRLEKRAPTPTSGIGPLNLRKSETDPGLLDSS